MILPVHERLRDRLLATLQHLYHLPPDALPQLAIEYPPKRELGDLATPVAFELARRLRKAPRAIAQELANALGAVDGIARVDAAPNGYLNVYLDRVEFVANVVPADLKVGTTNVSGVNSYVVPTFRSATPAKAIVEHTAINPNKAAHIGHLRNAALGDTLVRVQRFRGVPVEVQNYIDDTGVQVADVVVGFRELERKTLEEIRRIADTSRFDYYCWDLYARVTQWYDEDKDRLKIRAAALHDIEHGGNDTSDIARFIAERIVRCHLVTMARLNVDYDLLTWEGHILRLQFWARAFEILKEKGAVYLQTEGKLAGCWVMKIEEDEGIGDSGSGISENEDEDREKVIVRSNGTVTYVGKDIAYQFWKLGLLGRDFHYRQFGVRPNGSVLWSTSETPGDASHPPFGRASATYNVIDVRQSYLQKLLKQALRTLGYAEQADRATHFSYEMVALSNPTARTLGYLSADAPDDKRGFVDVSGRKGQGVKADDLLDTLVSRAEAEVAKRNPELSGSEHRRIAEMIAVAAVRYFMVKYSRTKIIAFDIDEALAFEGESGPYLQYAVVRAQNIFAKLRERDGLDETAVFAKLGGLAPREIAGEGGSHDLWALILEASRLDEIVEQVVRTLEFSVLAKYAFGLAQMFNGFYHRYPILNEEQADARLWRAAGVAYVRAQLTRALDLMGIAVPPRM
ncbi:MAG TPA: arginine--tRNA ligase [Vicinamibacterales bacterium]|nr:arginine--tRNA ligase [Vicinamibacterales bacterium]